MKIITRKVSKILKNIGLKPQKNWCGLKNGIKYWMLKTSPLQNGKRGNVLYDLEFLYKIMVFW